MNCNAKISRLRTKQHETTTAPKIKNRPQTFTHKMNVPQIRCESYDIENTHDDHCNGMSPKISHANDMPTGKCTQPQQSMTTLLPTYDTSMPSTPSSSPLTFTWDTQTIPTANTTTTIEPTSSSSSSLPSSSSLSSSSKGRMSMFFFRLHNLQREQENKRKKSVQQQRQRQRRGAKVFRSGSETGHLTLAPSRLFEKTPIKPSDSLDEIALQIPRYL